MSKWRESISFGRQHASEDGYVSALSGEILQLTVNMGVPYGFIMWLAAKTFFAEFDPPIILFIAGGAAFGLLMAITVAPGNVRVVVTRETADPQALVAKVRRQLERKGYEPLELSDRLCKLDRGVGVSSLSLGPISLSPMTTFVTLVTEPETVTFAGPAEILSKIIDPSDDDEGEL